MPIFELSVNLPKFSEHMFLQYKALQLDTYEAPFLEKKIQMQFNNNKEYHQHFTELKKYLALNHIYQTNLTMINKKIDAIWHQFILFSREYHAFCSHYFGEYMHHSPATEDDSKQNEALKKSAENFVVLYYQTFGELNDIWFKENH